MRIGGDRFDEAIINYMRRNYGILIGEATAERIKIEIGSAYPGQQVREMSVKGRNLSEGVPRSFTLNSQRDPRSAAGTAAGHRRRGQEALEQTPPELGADIAERGIVLTGGGALLRDIDRLLMEETGLPVVVADDPLTCVVRGGGRILELHRRASAPGMLRPRVARPQWLVFGSAGQPLARRRGRRFGFALLRASPLLSVVLMFSTSASGWLDTRPLRPAAARLPDRSWRCRLAVRGLALAARQSSRRASALAAENVELACATQLRDLQAACASRRSSRRTPRLRGLRERHAARRATRARRRDPRRRTSTRSASACSINTRRATTACSRGQAVIDAHGIVGQVTASARSPPRSS